MNESGADEQKSHKPRTGGVLGVDAGLALFEGGPTGRGVYANLRDRIVRLDLPPGTPLIRSELAQTHGVSLTPLRDALQQLAKEGLVRIFPQSRTLVTSIDTSAIREAQFLRIALETEIVRMLAMDIPPEDLGRLRSIVALQAGISENPDDMPTFQELDEVFHQTLFAAAGHMQSQRILRSHAGHLERLRRLDLDDGGSIGRVQNNRAVIGGHSEILDGIEARDAERAIDALRRHLQRTLNRMVEKRAAFPGYFAPGTD